MVNVYVKFCALVFSLIILSFLTSHLDVIAFVPSPFFGSDVFLIVFVHGPQLSIFPTAKDAVGFLHLANFEMVKQEWRQNT